MWSLHIIEDASYWFPGNPVLCDFSFLLFFKSEVSITLAERKVSKLELSLPHFASPLAYRE